MPRTLPAELTAVMDAGTYEPYIRVHTNDGPADLGAVATQPTAYRLEALRAVVTLPKITTDNDTLQYFRIERGALIDGVAYTISSIWFRTTIFAYNGKFHTLTGEPLDNTYLTIAAGSDYETVIETTLTGLNSTIVPSYEGTAAWKAYQFYPTGRTIVLGKRKQLFTLLRQKYLVFATEDGWDGSDSNMFFFCAPQTRAQDYEFTDILFNGTRQSEDRRLIFRDESSSIHTQGAATLPIHNLGFLPSTAAFPALGTNDTRIGARSTKLPVHLKYRTGDYARCPGDGGENFFQGRINVIEVLDLESTPAWYQIIEKLNWFAGTEGGAMPSTIEAAAPYTPLFTGNFDGILDTNDNNIQAALETLDNHGHYLPFGVYGTISPMSTSPSFPFSASIGRAMTLVSWEQAFYVDTTNDGSNYWTITIERASDSAVINSITTAAASASTFTVTVDTSFSIANLTASDAAIRIRCAKTGSPGALSLLGPVLEIT